VEIYSCLGLYELNGNGIFFDPNNDFSEGSQDFYEVHTSVHARYDELKAATSAEAGYTTEFPKIFVTFATDREDPNAVVYGTLCIISFVLMFCIQPVSAYLASVCDCHKDGGSSSTAPHIPHSAMSFNSSQTYDVPSRYTENVDQLALVQPLQGEYYINKYNDDYTTTDVAGSYSGRVTRLNLHTNDVASIRGLHRMPLLSELTLTNNNLRNLNGLNQSRSIRKLVVDDNNLSSLMGLQSSSLVSFRARSNDIRSLMGVQAASLQLLDCANNDIGSMNGIGPATTPSLKVLNLSNNDITDVSPLCNLGYLEAVCVSSNDIKSVDSIMAMIQSCPNLKYLDLRDNDLPESRQNQLKETCNYRKPVPIELHV
jgi:hypothetical protein